MACKNLNNRSNISFVCKIFTCMHTLLVYIIICITTVILCFIPTNRYFSIVRYEKPKLDSRCITTITFSNYKMRYILYIIIIYLLYNDMWLSLYNNYFVDLCVFENIVVEIIWSHHNVEEAFFSKHVLVHMDMLKNVVVSLFCLFIF